MAELSEKQLLLLDNYMYIQGSTNEKNVGRNIDYLLESGISDGCVSGGITPEQAQAILNEVKEDPVLCNMQVDASIDTDGVRAACFVDKNGNATVAFRGTGGSYEAWNDNVQGGYSWETKCQETAKNFIENSCSQYNNITVTGHSKGGNMAQYCTYTCGDKIDRCISYDGQGFSNTAIAKDAALIEQNREKIKSICCDEDYVNVLLNSIAGETVYLKTQEGANAHSSQELYLNNKNDIDENGKFTKQVFQSDFSKTEDKILDWLTDHMDYVPDDIKKDIYDLIGADVGLLFAIISGKMDFDVFMQYMEDYYGARSGLAPMVELKMIEKGISDSAAIYNRPRNYYKKHNSKTMTQRSVAGHGTADFSINLTRVNKEVQELKELVQRILIN